jgi:hypothetical protein
VVKSLTLRLPRPERPGGVKLTTISWNGHITDYWTGDHLAPTHEYLCELDDEERKRRLAELRERLYG